MKYDADFSDDVERWLKLASFEVRRMIGKEIQRLQAKPLRKNVRLLRSPHPEHTFVFRVGYYGIVFTIDELDDVIYIDDVYRVDTYRRRRRNPR